LFTVADATQKTPRTVPPHQQPSGRSIASRVVVELFLLVSKREGFRWRDQGGIGCLDDDVHDVDDHADPNRAAAL